MPQCPACSAELTGSGIRCPACGASLTVAHPTLKQDSPAAFGGQNKSSNSGTTISSSQGAFIAGTILDGRYRIVALLGRGGMGEVYKAEDLNLDHEVALKFLPDSFANDSGALTRFRAEVRIARQVTHANVCRVFDIGEFTGRHFLSMEYIDGEDLSSLLRRIGRLPSDKALEVSRQICAGLAAAHGAGVLHRDLKPANVMIDGRGKARITDFGIAGLEEELKKGGVIAGTPAYMSPEQITGDEITTKSDIYSLGLVLYELFTGKPAFQSDSISELVHKHQTITPTNPSEVLKEIDPLVEKTILRCLEKNPQLRPESALQVAAMLPGGDPLAAALAAGETPSPEMVAAAPTEGALKPVIAFACLAAGVVLIAVSMYASMFVLPQNRIPFDQSAEVMSARANDVIRKLGYSGTIAERFYRYTPDTSYQNYLRGNPSPDGWDKISTGQPLTIVFFERQGPRYFDMFMLGNGYWTFGEQVNSGMRDIILDTRGRLVEFSAVPPQFVEKPAEQPTVDWTPAFLAAELDQAKFAAGVPQWTPRSAYDARAAWTGTLPDHADIPIRVEAAAFQGKLVSFRIIYPWTKPDEGRFDSYSTRDWISVFIFAGVLIGVIIVAAFLVRKHLRSGSGDRRGAFKTSLFVFLVFVFGYLLTMDHVASFFPELTRFSHSIRIGLYGSVITWLIYLALEPIVRRNMPELIVSWNRLLAGDWRDPLIGRDVLLGALWGIAHCALIYFGFCAERLAYGDRKVWLTNESLISLRSALSMNLSSAGIGVTVGVLITCLLVIISLVVRRKLYAAIVLFLLITTVEVLFFTHSFVNVPFTLAIGVLGTLVVSRAGLLATVVSGIVFTWMSTTVLTLNFSAWYANGMFITVFLILVLLIYGFKISMANRPIFRTSLYGE